MPTLSSEPPAYWYVPRFCGRAGGPPRARRRPPSSGHEHGHGCGRGWTLDRVAGWVGGGIAAAFFASLERCSCVNVRTQDDLLDNDDEQRDSEAPLMFDDGNGVGGSVANGIRVSRRGGGGRSDETKRNGGNIRCYVEF